MKARGVRSAGAKPAPNGAAPLRLHAAPGSARSANPRAARATKRGENRTPPLEALSQAVARFTGSSFAFFGALAFIVAWALTGPLFGFSDTWQLVVNTATTIVTFLMVFLIQRAQNKDTRAIELKLNELLAAIQGASNRLIDVEDLSEAELQKMGKNFRKLAETSRREGSTVTSHTIEETHDE